MNVIGLFGFGTHPGACLLQDGRLVAFAEEERFTRIKGAPGLFPGRSVAYCLREAGLALDEVERIAFAWDSRKYPYRMLGALARQYVRYRGRAGKRAKGRDNTLFTVVSSLLQYTPGRLREDIRLGLRAHGVTGRVPPVEFVPHHLAHAYSAYFCSPYREAIVLTLDGSGEDVCTQVALGRGDELTVERSIPIPHSLGWFYAAFTAYFGFTPYRHEGKLMGLAGLGHARRRENPWPERLERVLHVADGGYRVDPTFTRLGDHSYAERFTDALARFVTGFDPRLGPVDPRPAAGGNGAPQSPYLDPAYVDLAWGVQAKLEEAATSVAREAARAHGLRNVCVAGGVGLNCKMNGALLAAQEIDAVFVQPASYDAGSALGAAMVVARAAGDDVRNPLEHAHWGPGWSSEEIRSVLERCKLSFEECPDVAERAAAELAAGRLVGWFQGRMEAGPRALGGRSILASPLLEGVQERLNREVKRREPWRPFCPALLDEARAELLADPIDAPFMTIAFRVREDQRARLAAVTHTDGSARPQTVRREAAPRFHRLISAFHERTGLPLVLNTSFNVDGEPIVCTPLEALRCFYASGLDALALGDFLLTKR